MTAVDYEQLGLGLWDEPAAPTIAEPVVEARSRFRILSDAQLAPSGERAKIDANMTALRLLRRIAGQGRFATAEERAKLARWAGWGAVPKVFDESIHSYDAERAELRRLLDDEEWEAARATVLNAHYTPWFVAAAVWRGLHGLAFGGGRVLEPGCGAGVFMGTAPDAAEMHGIELDPVTAEIASTLYPDASIRAMGFEDVADADATYTAAIGNVPFGAYPLYDPVHNKGRHSIHNYFILKATRLVAPGGIVAVVTSRYTLDARNPAARREIGQYADFLGAVRLPSGAMRAIAGTNVVTDVVFLRRLEDGQVAGEWPVTATQVIDGEEVRLCSWFVDHPEMVLGTLSTKNTQYGAEDLTVDADGRDLPSALNAGIDRIVSAALAKGLRCTAPAQPAGALAPASTPAAGRKEGSFHLEGDSFVVIRSGFAQPYTAKPEKDKVEMAALIALRDSARVCLDVQSDGRHEAELTEAQAALGHAYDGYVSKFGPLNRFRWQQHGRSDDPEAKHKRFPVMGGFRTDPDWPLVAALEVFDEDAQVATKAPIFTQRVVGVTITQDGADSAEDALAICLSERGYVDLDRIAELCGVTPDEARAELGDQIWHDPATGDHVLASGYLSGDVRSKLDSARAAAQRDPAYSANVTALEQVLPDTLAASEIDARLGAPWLPVEDIEAFVTELLHLSSDRVEIDHTPEMARWDVDVPRWARYGVAFTSEWGTHDADAVRLLEDCLNQKLTKVYDSFPDGKRVLNPAKTFEAREKQELIHARFREWVWEDEERAERLAELYNRAFNSYVPPRFDGSHLTLPGLAASFRPHRHQRNGAWRVISSPYTLLTHKVGAGKTATMVMAAMEMRRLGLSAKPAFAVPGHMLEQFGREFLQLYPSAKILLAGREDTSSAKRNEFVARCATGDWDAVILTHSAFGRLPVSAATRASYLSDEIARYRGAVEEKQDKNPYGRSPSVKRMEAAIKRLEARHEALANAEAKDDGVDFEHTGITTLFIDEAHLFKNLAFASNVDGVGGAGSQRAEDLAVKIRWLTQNTPSERVAVFATATPIANSVAEMYVMQRYLQSDLLGRLDIDHFDAWAAAFGETVTSLELAPDGHSYRMNSRFARFRNVPELLTLFHQVADVVAEEDLELDTPAIAGGQVQTVVVDPSDELRQYVADLVERAERIRNRLVPPEEDNMLVVTTDGRKAALDMRLVDGRDAGAKLAAAADNIAQTYDANKARTFSGSTRPGVFQMVFADLGTPKTDGRWSVYDELRHLLDARGVPADQIRFIHQAKSDSDKANLFAACRDGRVAVLIGSTEKMGVGTNAQTRMAALHHLDAPWRPADIEQRDGRGVRQGNECGTIEVYRYVTRGSFDAFIWSALERKARFIGQIMSGNCGREVTDVDDTVLSYAEVKALSSGDPRVIEHAGLQAAVAKGRRSRSAHEKDRVRLHRTVVSNRERADQARHKAVAYRRMNDARQDTRGDNFTALIDGQTYRKRADAGAALVERLRVAYASLRWNDHESKRIVVGRFAGFELALIVGPVRRQLVFVEVAGPDAAVLVELNGEKISRTNPIGLMTKVEHAIEELPEEAAALDRSADNLDMEADRAALLAERPWPGEAELVETEARLAALEAQLADDGNGEQEEAA